MRRFYFDHNATTPLDPRVLKVMQPWLGDRHGNPSSVHAHGQAAREIVEAAREQVAAALGARAGDVVFTASGTEANNAVVLGTARGAAGGRIVTSAIEHPSIDRAVERLEEEGWTVERIRPDANGVIDAEAMLRRVTGDTDLVCLMLANNEVGTLQPVREVAHACRQLGVPLLCDAVQAVGKVEVDVEELGVNYLVIGGHKFHGPLGAAALWIREGSCFTPLVVGGGQERGQRAGTENVAAIAGLGRAAELAALETDERRQSLSRLRDGFEAGLRPLGEVRIHGASAPRLPNTSNLAFTGVSAESLMIRLDILGFAVSAGAACSSGKVASSATLAAMGVSHDEAAASIRVSFGMTNSQEEVDELISALKTEVRRLRDVTGVATS